MTHELEPQSPASPPAANQDPTLTDPVTVLETEEGVTGFGAPSDSFIDPADTPAEPQAPESQDASHLQVSQTEASDNLGTFVPTVGIETAIPSPVDTTEPETSEATIEQSGGLDDVLAGFATAEKSTDELSRDEKREKAAEATAELKEEADRLYDKATIFCGGAISYLALSPDGATKDRLWHEWYGRYDTTYGEVTKIDQQISAQYQDITGNGIFVRYLPESQTLGSDRTPGEEDFRYHFEHDHNGIDRHSATFQDRLPTFKPEGGYDFDPIKTPDDLLEKISLCREQHTHSLDYEHRDDPDWPTSDFVQQVDSRYKFDMVLRGVGLAALESGDTSIAARSLAMAESISLADEEVSAKVQAICGAMDPQQAGRFVREYQAEKAKLAPTP